MNKNCYNFPKMKYLKNEIDFMYIFFDNGDFFEVKKSEIMDLSLNVYDKLIRSHKGFSPVIESGRLKLKICNKPTFVRSAYFLYNESEFKKDRKNYIENRCVNEGGITEIWLFDDNSWHKVLHCVAKAKKEKDFLTVEFSPQPQLGSFSNENHYVDINNVKKDYVFKIDLDFENCESFVVYNDEIEEINLVFNDKLEWGSGDLYREVIGGYIKIRLDNIFLKRENRLFDDKKLSVKDFERRLCGKKGERIHDICHLYIDYKHAGFGDVLSECVEVCDIKTDEEITRLEEQEGCDGEYYCFGGGYCKKMSDKSIIITFGQNAKNTLEKFNGKHKN